MSFPRRSRGWGGRPTLQCARRCPPAVRRGALCAGVGPADGVCAARLRRAAPAARPARAQAPRCGGRVCRGSRPRPSAPERHENPPARLPRGDRGSHLHHCCFCSPAGPEHPPGPPAGPPRSPGPDGLPVRRSPVRASTTTRVDPGVEPAPRHPVRSARHARRRASIPTASAHARRAPLTAFLPHAPSGRASFDDFRRTPPGVHQTGLSPPHALAGRASSDGCPPHAPRVSCIKPRTRLPARRLACINRALLRRTPLAGRASIQADASHTLSGRASSDGCPRHALSGRASNGPVSPHAFWRASLSSWASSCVCAPSRHGCSRASKVVFRRGGLDASCCRARCPVARAGPVRSAGRASDRRDGRRRSSFWGVRAWGSVPVAVRGVPLLFLGRRACGRLAAGLRASARVRVFWLLAGLAGGFLASLSPVGGPLGGGGQGDALACALVRWR